MADSTKVRLVRCPKCENLLPELADYSVYQCGGCGAVLRAKVKRQEGDSFSEKLDEERFIEVSAKSDNSLDKRAADLCGTSDLDVKSSTGSLRREQKGQTKEVIAEKWIVENGLDSRDEQANLIGREHGDLNSQVDSTSANHHSEIMPDWRIGSKGLMGEFLGIPRNDAEVMRFSTLNHQVEGPSNFQMGSKYSFGESLKKYNDPDGANRVQNLEEDRAELLKKLDELRDQLTRSCDVSGNPSKEKLPLDGRLHIPPEPYGGSDAWTRDGSLGPNRAPTTQFCRTGKYVVGPPNYNYHAESHAYNNGRERPAHSFLHSIPNPNHIPGYEESLPSQVRSGDPHGFPRHYQQRTSHPYFSQQYADIDSNSFELYRRDAMFHQPSCSCFHCYHQHQRVSAPVPPTTFHDKRFTDAPSHPIYYQYEEPPVVGPHVPNKSRDAMHSKNVLQSHTRWPSDLNSEMGYARSYPKKMELARSDRRYHPICGGAPFLTCCNCFEILQLPKKAVHKVKDQQKVLCGSCYTIINFVVVDKKIVLSAHGENIQTPMPVPVSTSFNDVVKDSKAHTHGHAKHTYAEFSSNDYDNSGYDFQSMDREPVLISTGISLNSSKPQELQSFHSSSPYTSEEENSPDFPVDARDCSNLHQIPIKTSLSPPPADSSLEKHFDFSSNNHAVNRFGKGNQSSRSDQEKVKPNKAASRQNSLKEASLATEMEVSFNEYSNTGISQDSGDASREEDRSKNNKGGESFFANIIKKSFKDFSRSNETDERSSTVSVNGHAIPDRVLKKAEKMAGPVQPGEYWYDFRAGFWGVIGGPCLGIIPPFIEEFNYPIPENCAAGNTTVFVNGRELHQKDLDLLACRGLPKEKNRSYIIEISGRVLDEDTGEELDSLGKLAPTVEKVKHGFGMKAPRAAAA